ncbi:hypothetical protein [Timonella senegalensis]|nr:hypothetical protein [Timonella senegalensis]
MADLVFPRPPERGEDEVLLVRRLIRGYEAILTDLHARIEALENKKEGK